VSAVFTVGAAIGLGLSIVEAGLRSGSMSSLMSFARQRPLAFLRPAASFLFFVLTRNAWLTAIGQAALIVAVSRTNRAQGGPEETAHPSNRS
jgi:Tfp pilus assembly protein FimV